MCVYKKKQARRKKDDDKKERETRFFSFFFVCRLSKVICHLFFSPFFFLPFFFREGKKNGEIILKKDPARESYILFFTHNKSVPCTRWKRRHRKPGRPSSRANTRTASSSVRTRECPRVRFVVVVVVASRGIF